MKLDIASKRYQMLTKCPDFPLLATLSKSPFWTGFLKPSSVEQ